MSHTVTFLALGKWVDPTHFEAKCSRCEDAIGTMKAPDLLRAIDRNSTRGGIMCVKCRTNSCHFCGGDMTGLKSPQVHHCRVYMSPDFKPIEDPIGYGYVKVCKLCFCDNWELVVDEVPF